MRAKPSPSAKSATALAIVAAACLALTACASGPTPYGPAAGPKAGGYSEQQIEANRYLVTVRGNFATDRARVEQMLLYRAAELTLTNGFDHFLLAARKTDANSRLNPVGGGLGAGFGSGFGLGLSYSWYSPRFGWRLWDDPIWADPPSYREITRFEASAEVAMFKGAKPDNAPDAYDARSVRDNLAAIATPPAAR
jgi:hypothetical protein